MVFAEASPLAIRERRSPNVMRGAGDEHARPEKVFEIADRDGIGYRAAADRMAEDRIAALSNVRLLDRPDTAHYGSRS